MTNLIKYYVDRSAFGVCSYLGDKIGISHTRVRMYFFYVSFVAVGSPIIFYLFFAFWINLRNYWRNSRNVIWR